MNLAEVIRSHAKKYSYIFRSRSSTLTVIDTAIIQTAMAMKEACKLEFYDFRSVDMDGNRDIRGEEYTQGYNDAVKDYNTSVTNFMYSITDCNEHTKPKD